MVIMTKMEIWPIVTLVSVVLAKKVANTSADQVCSSPLGVGDGTVKDNMMRASSSFSSATVGAENGRVGSERGGGAWCPASLVEEESKEWLEVELSKVARVTGLATQGRWAGGQGQEFAEWVRLQWWSDDQQRWVDAGAPMEANKDTYSKVEMRLEQEVQASKLRIIPVSQHPRMVCLRVELLGCWVEEDQEKQLLLDQGEDEYDEEIDYEGSEEVEWGEDYQVREEQEEEDGREDMTQVLKRVDTSHFVANSGSELGDILSQEKPQQYVVEEEKLLEKDTVKKEEVEEKEEVKRRAQPVWMDAEYMGVAVGVLVTVILVLIVVIVFILYKNATSPPAPAGEYLREKMGETERWEGEWSTGLKLGQVVVEEVYTECSPPTHHSNTPLLTASPPTLPYVYSRTPTRPPLSATSSPRTPLSHYRTAAGSPPVLSTKPPIYGGMTSGGYLRTSLPSTRGHLPPISTHRGLLTTSSQHQLQPTSHYATADLIYSGTGGRNGAGGHFL